jgi:predicted CXXCH cytochrome family protein
LSGLVRIRLLKQTLFVYFIFTCATVGYAGSIAGSKHDFSGKGWGSNEICVFCHTPHNANKTVTGSQLWNHQVSTATYAVYSSPTLQGTPEQPRGPSKLCLSCHDGTVAIDAFGNQNGNHYISGATKLGTDLSNDHPISIYWDHQTDQTSCSNCHSTHPMKFTSVLPFYSHYMECSTCHEPHNKGPEAKMLRKSLTGSAICLHCHGK